MAQVFSLLMAVMFPLRPLLRITRLFAWYMEQLANLADEAYDPEVRDDPWYRAYFEASVAFGEEGLNLLIGYRVQELLGQRMRKGHWRSPRFPTPRPFPEVLARYRRLLARLGHIERMARRRANRLRREMAKNPLNIIDPLEAIVREPALPLEVLPCLVPQSRIARICALARGPPLPSMTENNSPAPCRITCEDTGVCACRLNSGRDEVAAVEPQQHVDLARRTIRVSQGFRRQVAVMAQHHVRLDSIGRHR